MFKPPMDHEDILYTVYTVGLWLTGDWRKHSLSATSERLKKYYINTNIDSTASQETEHKRHVYVRGCV